MKIVTPEQVYREWLAALRSGLYPQAQGCLRDCEYDYNTDEPRARVASITGYCCLGVLEDLAVKAGGPGWNTEDGKDDESVQPRPEILRFMGLNEEIVDHLIHLNDDLGWNFERIADEIEGNIMSYLGYRA